MTLQAPLLGQPGFIAFLYALRRLQVLTQDELIAWVGLHREMMRLLEPPLDDGSGLDERVFAELERDLGEM